jgi:hypothetical protein
MSLLLALGPLDCSLERRWRGLDGMSWLLIIGVSRQLRAEQVVLGAVLVDCRWCAASND